MLDFLKKVFRKKRLVRQVPTAYQHIDLGIRGVKYSVKDYSESGFAVFNESADSLRENETHLAEVYIRGHLKSRFQVKVVRVTPEVTGFKVLDAQKMEELKQFLTAFAKG